MDDFAVDVSKAVVAARVTESESFVVESQLMQNGGVEIVHVNAVFCNRDAMLVGCPVDQASFCLLYTSPSPRD